MVLPSLSDTAVFCVLFTNQHLIGAVAPLFFLFLGGLVQQSP